MRDDFGVGLRLEDVSLCQKLALEIEEVLDHPVVDDDEPALAVPVRMGVLLGRTPVRRPAGVPDSEAPRHGLARENRLEVLQLAGAASDLEGPVAHHGDSC